MSPQGERAILALLAEQYAEVVDLRERLRQREEELAVTQEALRAATVALDEQESRDASIPPQVQTPPHGSDRG